jgi:hypothetical protein
MSVRYRLMQQKDVGTCVEHIAAHPILGPRYGRWITQLPAAIRAVLASGVIKVIVFEEFLTSTPRFLGAGIGVFVSNAFLQEAKTTPMFWVGPELVKRIANGKSPLLSEADFRDANSTVGLNLLVWHLSIHPQDFLISGIGTTVMSSFDQTFRGLRLREVLGQADCFEHLHSMRDAGGMYFDHTRGAYIEFPAVQIQHFSDLPRSAGISRDLALTRGTSWLSSLFGSYVPPRLSLSQSEQRLLRAALDGKTDEELADPLGISIYAVKMKWRMIYERAAACLPDIFAESAGADKEAHHRGKEKKQHLLDYVRKHPEELLPVSRKLLQKETAKAKPPRPGLVF